MENVIKTITECIKFELCADNTGDSEQNNKIVWPDTSARFLSALYGVSKKHDIAHLVGDALIKNGLIENGDLKSHFQNQTVMAVYRYENLNYELGRICEIFEEAKIPYIPLKGAVIRQFYPEPWMRTSCDIDILVHEEDLERAVKILKEKAQYETDGKKNFHDVSLYSPSGIHLELHYNIKETKENLDGLLGKAWEFTVPKNGYEYVFTGEFFLFHILAHASYHFLGGGCGIRPFIDLFLLKRSLSYDADKLSAMLSEAGIKKFAEEAEKLSEVWFGEGEHDEVTQAMEKFVLSGGVYGNSINHAAVKQVEKKGKVRHILSRIWMPYESLVFRYPNLKGKRILQPFYEIKRWFSLFKRSVWKRSVGELKTNAAMDKETVNETEKLIEYLGLQS